MTQLFACCPLGSFTERSSHACLTFEYPKSQTFRRGVGLPSSSVFSSFKSLWQTPCKKQCGHDQCHP
jgi:hypothetical protein